MKLTLWQKFRLFLIKSSLHFILFLEALEDRPQKYLKRFAKYTALLAVLLLFVGFLLLENQEHYLQELLRYSLYRRPLVSNTIETARPPKLVAEIAFPTVSSRAFIIADLATNTVLQERNSKTPLPPASTTKMMTALVSRDLFKENQFLKVPEICTQTDSQQIGFFAEEFVSVEDLLHALLISSAGDAACTLAYGSGDYQDFINRMNRKALDNNMKSTNFVNPVGLDDFSDNQLSSAYDLYQLALLFRKDHYLQSLVEIKDYNLASGDIERKIFNTNDLLWDVPGTVGIKTGRTYGAGEVLVYEYNRDNKNILIIVMGSEDRFGDTKEMLSWILQSYSF